MRINIVVAVLGLAAMTVGTARASWIPPRAATVVTKCGQVTAVYTTTRSGYVRHTGIEAAQIANKVPYNRRIESGCSK